uniref:ATP synthase F0 subunit 6 n=1 Tax=Aglaiogyrodactylus forficulatus TaxID=1853073 RepID=A0A173G4R6_9PLAT|nr:ATP synthase F0 subunit 6 [Aglaiogyrodactylus forficulatus]ANH20405.1 ATP synthase F0 subunit 6 [Aglaiogyrodactylus forficulatus]
MFINTLWSFFLSSLNTIINEQLIFKNIAIFGLLLFLVFRVPGTFINFSFMSILFLFFFILFITLFLTQVLNNFTLFLSNFVPSGTPLWIAPFVCIAESLSYLVRPFVLILRPFINITIGILGGLHLSGVFSLSLLNPALLGLLVFIFFYEVFVAAVHWYIALSILQFSKDH